MGFLDAERTTDLLMVAKGLVVERLATRGTTPRTATDLSPNMVTASKSAGEWGSERKIALGSIGIFGASSFENLASTAGTPNRTILPVGCRGAQRTLMPETNSFTLVKKERTEKASGY